MPQPSLIPAVLAGKACRLALRFVAVHAAKDTWPLYDVLDITS